MKQAPFITTVFFLGLTNLTLGQNLFPYRHGQVWGFCDSAKNIFIKPQYQSADIFSHCNIATVQLHNKYGFINKAGREITDIKYTRWSFFWINYTYVWLDKKVGLIDSNGKEIIPVIYDDIIFTGNMIGLKLDHKWGLFNGEGREICKPIFQEVNPHSYRLTGVRQDKNWGFMDSTGQMRIQPAFEEINGFSKQGLCAVKQNGKWGFIDFSGAYKVKPIYDEVNAFHDEGCWVKTNSKWGLINTNGETIIPFDYEQGSYFREGLAYAKKNGRWGFINKNGAEIIPFSFEQAFEFCEGLAEVCNADDSCGYINKEGKVAIPFVYTINYGGEFNEGLAEVRIGDKYGFINALGVEIVPVKYSTPYDYNSFDDGVGMLLLSKDPDNEDADFAKCKFYFDKKGTIFYEE